ncbi:unnamed protein product [Phaedon cochleariae]|uniref:Odorant receptor n=1 Tax=Phaedon cochleariae TaxID=80249 RepID=A0A9P0GQK8_PHACE|nr:unnamed protein product [Phaedon cochleariae]
MTSFLCYKGQRLIDEGEALCEDIYSVEWYSMSRSFQLDVMMILHRTQTPIRSYAGVFYGHSYSYELLMFMVQASYSYTTVITQLQ